MQYCKKFRKVPWGLRKSKPCQLLSNMTEIKYTDSMRNLNMENNLNKVAWRRQN